jgi:glycerol uptake facilitator-like aquaporin
MIASILTERLCICQDRRVIDKDKRDATAVASRRHLLRTVLAEFLGTAGLVAIVVGSGIAAARLSPADAGLQLLENSLATALGLAVLIVMFQPISGSHFNPVVTLALLRDGDRLAKRSVPWLIAAQCAGALAGVAVASAMFEVHLSVSTTSRATPGTVLAEVVATMGLVSLILMLVRTERARLVGPAVGAYIGAAYWFTSSTSFANPAVTLGRVFTDTFAGIDPGSAVWFLVAQGAGAACAVGLARLFLPRTPGHAS